MQYDAAIVADGLVFPEGPRWHDGRLYFSDFLDRRIAVLTPGTGAVATLVALDDSPSGLGWRPDGTLLFVSMARRRLCALIDGAVETVAELGPWVGGRANDMAIDADGGAYIGNFGFDMLRGEAPRPTALIYVSPRGAVSTAADGLVFPNGIALLDGGRTLVVAETYANRLTAFDVGPGGALVGRRVWAQLGAEVAPDGICAGADGAVWVATARDGRCLLVADGGAVRAKARVGEGIAYACMTGEAGELFICAAPGFRPAPGQRDGRIWRAVVD